MDKDALHKLYKEFTYEGVTVTRRDYESMPCPMRSIGVDDDTMQKIAEDTHRHLIDTGWTQDQVDKYLAPWVDPAALDATEIIEYDAIEDDLWRFAEMSALEHGMEYYEDMKGEQ